jgi:alginate O-acetyltransferase complex protein AlgI
VRAARVIGIFVLSGVFHEAAISYPAGAGWGGPLLYFVTHGALVAWVEPKIKSPFLRRVLTWAAILLPLPLLFHAPFRSALILPLLDWLSRLIHFQTFDWYFNIALWLGSAAHFCILGASFQVPTRLKWKEEFALLSDFNRKIFWTYGAFIVLSIVALGTLSGVLHGEMMRGDKSAVAVSVWIGIFWGARVGVDLLYFKPGDWPRGRLFEIGHTFLTFAFVCLAVLFGVVVPWHAWWARG